MFLDIVYRSVQIHKDLKVITFQKSVQSLCLMRAVHPLNNIIYSLLEISQADAINNKALHCSTFIIAIIFDASSPSGFDDVQPFACINLVFRVQIE